MIRESISKVVGGEDLTESEMEKSMDEIMTGTATPAQIGAFITALRLKGERLWMKSQVLPEPCGPGQPKYV